MAVDSKLYIATKSVLGPFLGLGPFCHLYLVYDKNGNTDSYLNSSGQTTQGLNDEYVLRGGPQFEEQGTFAPTGNIKLEIDRSLLYSFDNIESGHPISERDYTLLPSVAGKVVDSVWNDLITFATGFGNGANDGFFAPGGTDPVPIYGPNGNGVDQASYARKMTNAPYGFLGALGVNSNSTGASFLAMEGIDVFKTLPYDNASHRTLTKSNFTDIERMYLSGSTAQTIYVMDWQTSSVTDYGTGNSTISVDVAAMQAGRSDFALTLTADSVVASVDKIALKSLDLGGAALAKAVYINKDSSGKTIINLPNGAKIRLDGAATNQLAGFDEIDVTDKSGNNYVITRSNNGAAGALAPLSSGQNYVFDAASGIGLTISSSALVGKEASYVYTTNGLLQFQLRSVSGSGVIELPDGTLISNAYGAGLRGYAAAQKVMCL